MSERTQQQPRITSHWPGWREAQVPASLCLNQWHLYTSHHNRALLSLHLSLSWGNVSWKVGGFIWTPNETRLWKCDVSSWDGVLVFRPYWAFNLSFQHLMQIIWNRNTERPGCILSMNATNQKAQTIFLTHSFSIYPNFTVSKAEIFLQVWKQTTFKSPLTYFNPAECHSKHTL